MKKTLLILTLTLHSLVNAQNFEWVNFPSTTIDFNPAMATSVVENDSDGNLYYAGYKNTPISATEVFGNVYYKKISTNGTLLFEKEFSGKVIVVKMKADNSNNMLVAVKYRNSITIDGFSLSSTNGNTNSVLLKFNANGVLLWHKPFAIGTTISAIYIDNSNNIYAGSWDFNNSSIEKIDSTGNTILTIHQNNVEVVYSISVDEDGNIYSAGGGGDLLSTFSGVSYPINLTYNLYIAKYSLTGVSQWVKYVEDVTTSPVEIVTKSSNEIYISSYTYDFVQNPFAGFATEQGVFLAKLNSNGVFQWVKQKPINVTSQMNIRKSNFLSIDSQGFVYLFGDTKGTIDWSNTITTSTLNKNILVLKYNSNGEVVMAKTAGGTSAYPNSISLDQFNNIFISGFVTGNSMFDVINHTANSSSEIYPFYGKITNASLGIYDAEKIGFSIFPNPVDNLLSIKGLTDPATAEIFNFLGQKMKTIKLENNKQIDINDLASGIYTLVIEKNSTLKFIKK